MKNGQEELLHPSLVPEFRFCGSLFLEQFGLKTPMYMLVIRDFPLSERTHSIPWTKSLNPLKWLRHNSTALPSCCMCRSMNNN